MDGVKDEPDTNLDLFGEQNLEHDLRDLFSPNQSSPRLSYAIADNLGGGSHQMSPPPQAISVKQEHCNGGDFMDSVPTNGSHRSEGVPPLSGMGSSSAAQKRGANVFAHPQSYTIHRPHPHPNLSSSCPN